MRVTPALIRINLHNCQPEYGPFAGRCRGGRPAELEWQPGSVFDGPDSEDFLKMVFTLLLCHYLGR